MALAGIILDMDGTLVDTNELHVRAWERALERFGYRLGADRLRPAMGKGGDKLVPDLLGTSVDREHGDGMRDAETEEFQRLVEREGLRVFPDLEPLLRALRDRGLRLALATSSDRDKLDTMIERMGIDLESLVDSVVTRDDTGESKPAPDLVEAAVRALELAPTQCAMIGDTPWDAIACRRAGVVCLAVLCGGTTDRASLLAAGARAVWDDPAALLADLDRALEIASPGPHQLTRERLDVLMHQALDAARDGMSEGEVPVGAVLAHADGRVIARTHDREASLRDPTAHAEMLAFRAAAGGSTDGARDLVLVSTLEPCPMCLGAAVQAGVETVVYALPAPPDGGRERLRPASTDAIAHPRTLGGVLADRSRHLLTEWVERAGDDQRSAYVRRVLAAT